MPLLKTVAQKAKSTATATTQTTRDTPHPPYNRVATSPAVHSPALLLALGSK